MLFEVVQAMGCPLSILSNKKVKEGVINLIGSFDTVTLEQLRAADKESYFDVLQFLVASYRDMDLDDRIAHFSCRCACEKLEELQNKVYCIRNNPDKENTHISKQQCKEWVDLLQKLVIEISCYSQYEAWARDTSSLITAELLHITS